MQRWPAVPTAANTIERTAISKSAEGVTTMPLFPPSSRSDRPSRAATVWATARPIRTEPVAEISGIRRGGGQGLPDVGPGTDDHAEHAVRGLGHFRQRAAAIAWQAMAHRGVFSDGFQTTASPQTRASIAFQAQTATGKLKAVITPTGPRGCHCSARRCRGRSLAIVRP